MNRLVVDHIGKVPLTERVQAALVDTAPFLADIPDAKTARVCA